MQVTSSCDCVQFAVRTVNVNTLQKPILIVRVAADRELTVNLALSVVIEALRIDGSTATLSYEFTHVGDLEDGTE